jgi:hypothetical protein
MRNSLTRNPRRISHAARMCYFYTTGHPCRHCQSLATERVPRPFWLKVFPAAIFVKCLDCGGHFATRAAQPRKLIDL